MAEPIIEIVFDDLYEALDISSILFKEMGWNENGVPTKAKLNELDINWVIDHL